MSPWSALRCPLCGAALGEDGRCDGGHEFPSVDGVFDLVGDRTTGAASGAVGAFYDRNPFPAYAADDDVARLMQRARRSAFLAALDDLIPQDATVLDLGCGTGQLTAFLALAAPRRTLLGADLGRASLREAEGFRRRSCIANVRFVRIDLFAPVLEPRAFDVVVCRGVVHHTADPDAAIEVAADHVAPGGLFVLGFYETFARAWHRTRRALFSGSRAMLRGLDPILRARDLDPAKERAWIEDQYAHPVEVSLALPRVVARVRGLGFDVLRAVPPVPTSARGGLAAVESLGSGAMWMRRVGWALRGITDADAGLVTIVARRR